MRASACAALLAPCSLALLLSACGAGSPPSAAPAVLVELPGAAPAEAPVEPPGDAAPSGWWRIRCRSARFALVLVLHLSPSASGAPMEAIQAAAIAALARFDDPDIIDVIVAGDPPLRVVKAQPARNRARIAEKIGGIQPGGGAEIFAALDAAFQVLAGVTAERKHVIVVSDGAPAPDGVDVMVSVIRAEGFTLSTIALGPEADAALLRTMAEAGGGRFHLVGELSRLRGIVGGEVRTVLQRDESSTSRAPASR